MGVCYVSSIACLMMLCLEEHNMLTQLGSSVFFSKFCKSQVVMKSAVGKCI